MDPSERFRRPVSTEPAKGWEAQNRQKKQQRNSQEEHETTSISLTEFLVKNNV